MHKNKVEIKIDTSLDDTVKTSLDKWCQIILNRVFERAVCLSIQITSDNVIQQLNEQFRDKNTPTNILSFPDQWPEELVIESGYYFIGDMVISAETVMYEAEQQSKSLTAHWQHMLTHGILHLAGHDHIKDAEALEMEQLEIDILATMNVPNPYIENN